MIKLDVFYHVFAPNDYQCNYLFMWLDEQLGLMRDSRLSEVANVYLGITMPVHQTYGHFGNHVLEFLSKRYPFAQIINIRDSGDPNLYEGQTLECLHQKSQHQDGLVLYLHTKGTSNPNLHTHLWRQVLNHFCISQWPECVNLLQSPDVDLVGVRDLHGQGQAVSGNFWWSKYSYIKTLPPPLDSAQYQKDPDRWPGGDTYRYAFEDWYWLNRPRIQYIADTQVDHYASACFPEDLHRAQT